MTNTPAGDLVRAFGDAEAMSKLYADNVRWELPAGSQLPALTGKDAVVAFNREVWSTHYRPDCRVEIHDELQDGDRSAVRFTYHAYSNHAQRPYTNDYTVFVRSGEDGIEEIFEAFDTVVSMNLHQAAAEA